MENLEEYSKEIVDRFIRAMGYDPKHIDRDKRMAFTKTIRFQEFARRMGDEARNEQVEGSPTTKNRPYTKGWAQSRVHTKDMALHRSVHVNKPQSAVKTEALDVIKHLHQAKINRLREDLYDHEKDSKGGKEEQPQAAAVLKGGKTMTGQPRDTVEIDPVMKKNKPAAQNTTDDNT
jgi:hypothetical protein